jgi:hypothetical protein
MPAATTLAIRAMPPSCVDAKLSQLGIVSPEFPNGLGRAAIVRRDDGLLCIYRHWIIEESARKALNLVGEWRTSWLTDERTPPSILYDNADPEPGLYGTVEDARRQVKSLPGFSDAQKMASD